jgi:hypothetical protein
MTHLMLVGEGLVRRVALHQMLTQTLLRSSKSILTKIYQTKKITHGQMSSQIMALMITMVRKVRMLNMAMKIARYAVVLMHHLQ